MTKAKCFNCGITVEGIEKPMEELIEDRLPLFCSNKCAKEFPVDEDEIQIRFKKLKNS